MHFIHFYLFFYSKFDAMINSTAYKYAIFILFFSMKIRLNHECKQCGEQFDSSGKLNKHTDKMHPVPEYQKLSCEKCNLKFSRATGYRDHMESQLPAMETKCYECQIF